MSCFVLRNLACSALLGLVVITGVQAQTSLAATLPDFTGIVERNAPAVVHVEAKYTGEKQRADGPQGMPGQGSADDRQAEIMRRFFGMPMMPSPQQEKHTSLGSGFIISSDGYILTNNHVVDHADRVTVRLQDRRTLTAKVVGTDPTYDIALLKVDAGGSLPAVSIGNSRSLKAGQWVLAIGSPFGFDYTVTQGIVSAVGRNLGQRDQPYTSFIQTDVPINRGNSGGPLFDLQGRVVGVNSQIYSNTGDYMGVAFSIPIDLAMNAVEQLKGKGYVSRGMLGVTMQPVDDDIVKAFNLDNGAGAVVVDVTPGSGAAKAGIQPGDIILTYNGQTLQQASDLPPLVGLTKPDSVVAMDILRNGKKQALKVTISESSRDKSALAARGASPSVPAGSAALGLTVKPLDSDASGAADQQAVRGVAIAAITGPVAEQAGLQEGDIILMVNQRKVTSVAEFQAATRDVKAGSTVLLLVRRGEQSNFVGLTVPGDK